MTEISTYDDAVTRLQSVLLHLDSRDGQTEIVQARDEVLDRFRPIFSREHLPELTQHEFHSFLLLENNKHWSGLHRHSPRITSDMARLRSALDLLLYGEESIEGRFTQAVSEVTGMGRAVASALLLVVHPQEYGVWNSTSEGGLKFLNLWPRFERGASLGERYVQINNLLKQLAGELGIDLWTLDVLWWDLENPEILAGEAAQLMAAGKTRMLTEASQWTLAPGTATVQAFALERHLHDFLWTNWESTALGRDWELYSEEGEPDAGYEYPSGVGRIDLLARHRTEKQWLVIELKKDQTSDASVGQVLRYMGWVKQELAEPGDKVRGLIIAHDIDDKLCYAASVVPDIELQRYEVEFHLRPVPEMDKASG